MVGRPAVLQVGVRGRVADQHRGVDLRGQDGGAEDPGHVEPLGAGPDPLPGPDPVNAHPLCGGGAEHRHRLLLGRGVEEYPVCEGGADRGGQAQAGGVDAERVGVHRGDVGAAEGALVADRADVLHVGDPGHHGDHPRRGLGQLRGAAGQRLPVLHGQQVGAQRGDLRQQPRLGGGRQAKHRHDRGHPDRDAQRRQRSTQLAGAQADRGQPGQIRRMQPGRRGRDGGHDVPSSSLAGHGRHRDRPPARPRRPLERAASPGVRSGAPGSPCGWPGTASSAGIAGTWPPGPSAGAPACRAAAAGPPGAKPRPVGWQCR